MMWASCLLYWHGIVALEVGDEGSTHADERATTSVASPDQEIDEPVFRKESLKLCPFQTQIIECKTKPILGESTHMMIISLRAYDTQPDGVWPLLLGLHVLHAYTWLKMSSGKVSIVVRNMSDSPIFLKKGVWVTHMASTSPVPPVELSPEMEAALGAETACEPMMVAGQQEKLLEKLNLDGLSNWTPRNVAAAEELILAFHDIVLDGNELGCTSVIEHEISINNSEPFKEQFRCIPPPLLDEVCASLRDMLDAGAICPSQSLWCNTVVLVQRKDGTLHFYVDFCRLQCAHKKGLVPTASVTGSAGEHSGCHTFFNNGL